MIYLNSGDAFIISGRIGKISNYWLCQEQLVQESPEVDLNPLPVQHKSENTAVTRFKICFPHIHGN